MGVNNPPVAPVQNPMEADLDTGGFDVIGFGLNKGFSDDNGNEILRFIPAAAAVNFVLMSNAAAGNSVLITTSGGADLNLAPAGGLVEIQGAYTLPPVDGSARHYLRTDGAGAVNFTRGEPLVISLFDPTAVTNYIETDSTGYVNIAQFVYSGSAVMGTITSMTAVVWTNDAAEAASIKIIDETNSNDIDEVTGIVSTSTTNLAGFPSILNVPVGAAVLSVNILTASAARRCRVSSVLLNF